MPLTKIRAAAAAAALLCLPLAAGAQTVAAVTVDATKPIRVVDNRQFGLNAPFWDTTFTGAESTDSLTEMGTQFMRFGGGSATDEYNWQTNTDIVSNDAWAFNVDAFAAKAQALGFQGIITTNYGSGTAAEAADYVQYTNVTKHYGFKYWEIGNECYGTWEYDTHAMPHDGVTYATAAAQYITQMKAVDPTIKVGVVVDASEDSFIETTAKAVTNPVTGLAHSGWTPIVLTQLASLGVYPDFVIYHNYPQGTMQENDAALLQISNGSSSVAWPVAAANLRMQLNDYLGAKGKGIEILVTENNSVSTSPGKQSVSLVNGLYLADSTAALMQTEINGLCWWDFHNGQAQNTTAAPINVSSSLYGWRLYGDYGVEQQSTNDRYPTFYAAKLLSHYARGGDTVITTASSDPLLAAYAVTRVDGSMSILVINKSPTATYAPTFSITGFTPQPTAKVYSYGMPQDDDAEQISENAATANVSYSWENSLGGWVNQSGQPDTTATNYGLDAPFLYSLSFSTATGVTNGTYSLACATTASDPGDSAVIQNSSAAVGTALSNATSVALDIYPQVAAGTTVQVSVYINGTNIPYVLLGTKTVNVNQENTVTFPVTAAQRTGIASSLGSGNYFQVGINVNSPAPLTAYLDNFVIAPVAGTGSSATTVPGAASSPDIAVSTLANVGTSFSATFAPYSATVLSLGGPTSAPTASVQPTSQTVASGHTVTFSFPATGGPTPAFQWYLNGVAVAGATHSTLVVNGATAADAGTYTCKASNASGTLTSSGATLNVAATNSPGRLVNVSSRAQAGTGSNIIFGGFAIGPTDLSGHETVLIRASGPALTPFGVPGVLPDPQVQLFDSAGMAIAGDLNTGWGGGSDLVAVAAAVGAFAWTSATSHDAALYLPLAPGAYTAQVAGESGDTGVALMEVYDTTPAASYLPTDPRLVNLSARVDVQTGAANALFVGFVIHGTTSMTVLIRVSGPALADFGVAGTLPDPQLSLQTPSGTIVGTNAGWGGDAEVAATAASVGAFPWKDGSSADSAVLVTLAPGAYNVVVDGVGGDAGAVLVEVYEIP